MLSFKMKRYHKGKFYINQYKVIYFINIYKLDYLKLNKLKKSSSDETVERVLKI